MRRPPSDPESLLPPTAPRGDEIEVSELGAHLRRRLWIPAICLALGVGLAAWVSANTRPMYRSDVRILFPGMAGGGGSSTLLGPIDLPGGRSMPIAMYAEVLRSTQLVQPIAQKYHLSRYKIKIEEAKDVNKIVQVSTNPRAATLTLSTLAPTPDLAQKMSGDLCEALSAFVRKAALSDTKSSAAYLKGRIDEIENNLKGSDETLKRYQEANKIAGATAIKGDSSGGRDLSAQLTEVTAALNANQARIAEINRQLRLQVANPQRLTESSPIARKWRDQLSEKSHQLALAQTQYGPDHPEVVLLKSNIADLQGRIAREIARSRYALDQGVTPEIAVLLADREALSAQKASLDAILRQIPAHEMRISQLLRQNTVLSSLYANLQTKYQEARLAEMSDPSRFVFLDTPNLPKRAESPRWKRNMALGGLVGLLLGATLTLSLPASTRRHSLPPGPAPEATPPSEPLL